MVAVLLVLGLFKNLYLKDSEPWQYIYPVLDRGTGKGARDRHALQQLALNVHVKHSDCDLDHDHGSKLGNVPLT